MGKRNIKKAPATLEDLKQDPDNARMRTDKGEAVLKHSLEEFGAARSVVIDKDGIIRAGNGTVEAAQAAGITKIRVVEGNPDELVVVQRSDLEGERAKKYAVADNRTAELAEWDLDVLETQLETFDDIEGLGFSPDDMQEFFPPDPEDIEDVAPQLDRADELQAQWGTEKGQLWTIEGQQSHRLLCGDCRDSADVSNLVDRHQINLAFTSPPYASQRDYDEVSGFHPIPPDKYVEWFEDVQANVSESLAAGGSWFVNIKEHCDDGERVLYVKDLTIAHVRRWGWSFIDELAWVRGNPVPGGFGSRFKNGFEPIFHFSKGRVVVRHQNVLKPGQSHGSNKETNRNTSEFDSFDWKANTPSRPSNVIQLNVGQTGDHPASFPIGLPTFFIKAYSDESDHVYDPFLGSGTTMLAAEQLNRRCFGLEISPKYCAVILQRMQDAGCECTLENSV